MAPRASKRGGSVKANEGPRQSLEVVSNYSVHLCGPHRGGRRRCRYSARIGSLSCSNDYGGMEDIDVKRMEDGEGKNMDEGDLQGMEDSSLCGGYESCVGHGCTWQ